jgi:hypothetical protein
VTGPLTADIQELGLTAYETRDEAMSVAMRTTERTFVARVMVHDYETVAWLVLREQMLPLIINPDGVIGTHTP